MRWAIALVLAGCNYNPDRVALASDAEVTDLAIPLTDTPPPPDDETPPPPPPLALHLYVEGRIDGRSNLIIQGTNVTWMHFQFAAPGREGFTNFPTLLDATPWQPVWPDNPDAENRECNCMSSTFTALPVALPAAPSEVTVTHVKGRRLTTPSALQLPAADNNYTLILEFTDVGISGSDNYGANIDVVPLSASR